MNITTMATKTPAMVLQEFSIQECGRGPTYELITQNQGTHENLFEYVVDVLGIEAMGRGRSKKDAKQETAKNALVLLQAKFNVDFEQMRTSRTSAAVSSTTASVQLSPDDDLPSVVNHIGELADACMINGLPIPEYVMIDEDGPAHHKSFTYECRLMPSLVRRHTASTKKLAKQHAAKKLFAYIKDVLPNSMQREGDLQPQLQLCDGEQITSKAHVYVEPTFVKTNLADPICNSYLHLGELVNDVGVQLDDIHDYLQPPHTHDKLEAFAKALGLEVHVENLGADTGECCMYYELRNTLVPLCTLGTDTDEQQACDKALKELFSQIITLLTPMKD